MLWLWRTLRIMSSCLSDRCARLSNMVPKGGTILFLLILACAAEGKHYLCAELAKYMHAVHVSIVIHNDLSLPVQVWSLDVNLTPETWPKNWYVISEIICKIYSSKMSLGPHILFYTSTIVLVIFFLCCTYRDIKNKH